jgi:hypothetical protein
LDGGMPIGIILDNEQYLDCFAENGMSFREFPTGLLGRIYKEMSVTDDGKERFGELFIEDHKMDLALGNNVFDAMESGEKIGPEQRADIEVFREMGGNVLLSMADSYNARSWRNWEKRTEWTSYEEQAAKDRKAGRQLFDYLMSEKIIDSADASLMFEVTRKELANSNRSLGRSMEDVLLTCAIESDLSLHSDDEDTNYWMSVCKERRENVFEVFDAIAMDEEDASLEDFDFDDKHAMRLLADIFGNKRDYTVTSIKPRLYEKMSAKGLLDSAVFREELVRAIGKCCEADDASGYGEQGPMAVSVLAARRGVLEELFEQGLFDKYPQCKSNKTIQKVVDGSFTEKDRLGLFGYGFADDEFYDENGEVNERFYEYCAYVDGYVEVLDDDETRRLCENCLESSDFRRLAEFG